MSGKAKEEEEEIWKTYPKIPFIEASNFGRVRTKDRVAIDRNGRKLHIKGRVLKQQLCPNGYMEVKFGMNGEHVYLLVHRVIAASFLPNPDNLPEVNHKDNDPTNNRLDNLEYCTHEYNMAYREKYGKALGQSVFAVDLEAGKVLYFESQNEAARQLGVSVGNLNMVLRGERIQTGGYWFTKNEDEITEEKILEVKAKMYFLDGVIAINVDSFEIFWFKSQREAAHQLEISAGYVNMVLKGRQNKAKGYWFCYVDENAVEKARKKFGDNVAKKVEELMRQNQKR